MTRNSAISMYFHIHLVSDSTGETLVALMKASCAQFRDATPIEHLYPFVRSPDHMIQTLQEIEGKPGIVLYTIANPERRKQLEDYLSERRVPHLSILDPTLSIIGRYLGASITHEVGAQRTMDSDYYKRIDALDYAMAHDDGQNMAGLKNADIILLGISRTSKTPTSIYLANRGLRTGNIPLVPGAPLPTILDSYEKPFIVGLIATPDRIAQIRSQRLINLNETHQTDYSDVNKVRDEMRMAKRMFVKKGYPVVDVTRRSIEETAAKIITLYQQARSTI